MDISILLAAFLLGLSASPRCLAVCMPVMVPMITSDKDSSFRSGTLFSVHLALGRLLVYISLAAATGYVGHVLFDLDDEGAGDLLIPRLIMGIIAVVVIVYATALLKGWQSPLSCPRQFLPSISKKNQNSSARENADDEEAGESRKADLIPFMLGVMFGSILCPPFLILLGTTLASAGFLVSILAGMLFWFGTLPVNLLGGGVSGEFGRKWRIRQDEKEPAFVTNVSAITLLLVGLWWLVLVAS